MKATRQQVYEVIDGEREYQEQRWGRPEHNHSVTEYLVYMQHYVNQALAKVSTQNGDLEAKHDVRKIAALAVACMEENGPRERPQCPRCKTYETHTNSLCTACYHDPER